MKLTKKLQSAGLLHKGALVRHTAALEASDFLSLRSHSRLRTECELNSMAQIECVAILPYRFELY